MTNNPPAILRTTPTIVEKRDHTFVGYDFIKIQQALDLAISEIKDKYPVTKETYTLLLNNIELKIRKIAKVTINIETIQDIIIEEIDALNLSVLSHVYSTYREMKSRERKAYENRIVKTIDSYIDKATWEVNENANMEFSIQGLNIHMFSKFNETYWKNVVFKEKLTNYHDQGDFHIHDLYLLSPYCVGWDLKDLLVEGFKGVPSKVSCLPPKHFDAACGQIVNFLYTMQGETAGAVAFSNIDTYLAPFIEKDGLLKDRKRLYQDMQKMIYNFNVPTRVGFQCVTEDTEIYTTAGWVTKDTLAIGDTIYVLNMTTKVIETDTLTGINEYKYNGIMHNLKSASMDQLVTPNHNCIIFENNEYAFQTAEKLMIKRDKFITPTATISPDLTVVNEEITSLSYVYDYDGIVWCPTTESGTFIARRNGTIFITGNSPFTNLTLDLECPKHLKNDLIVVGGKYSDTETYGDFQDGMDAFNDVFSSVMTTGDERNKVFTFPIPTYCIDNEFDWDNPKYNKIWEMATKFGIPYFANYINSDMSKEDTRSMCCRLKLDISQLNKRGGGLFGANSLTGSIGVVTINLARIGHLASSKKDFLDRIKFNIDRASEILIKKTEFLEKMTDIGMYPYSKYFLRHIKKIHNRYWANHFLTIGIIGMHEACINFFRDERGIEGEEGDQLTTDMMTYINEYLIILQEKTGYLYNLEASPAESTGYTLLQKDKKYYPKMHCFKVTDKLAYTNSTSLPLDTKKDFFEALAHQDKFQSQYSGGTVFHSYLQQAIHDPTTTKNLIKRVLSNYNLPYLSITPTFSICDTHGYQPGEIEKCPDCNQDNLIYSRVVGYLRPVNNWNISKKQEFDFRHTYNF